MCRKNASYSHRLIGNTMNATFTHIVLSRPVVSKWCREGGGVCQSLDKEKRHQICPVTLIFLQMDFKTSYSDSLSELDFLTFNKCIYHLPMLHLSFWWQMVGTPPLPLCTPLLKALQLKLINPTVTVGCVGHLALARNLVLTFQAAYKNTRLEYNCWL